jgi:hypothetical protein
MKQWMGIALLVCGAATQAQGQTAASAPSSPAKKELVAKLLRLQQRDIETLASQLALQPSAIIAQQAQQVLQQMPADKRDAVSKNLEVAFRKYNEEASGFLRDRAVKLAPSLLAPAIEQRFTEGELKQLVAWYESPVKKKFEQALPEIQPAFVEKLVAEGRPVIDPKLATLTQSVRTALGVGTPALPGASAPAK